MWWLMIDSENKNVNRYSQFMRQSGKIGWYRGFYEVRRTSIQNQTIAIVKIMVN